MFKQSFPDALFFFFHVKINSLKIIALFRPAGSVYSGSASWDDCRPKSSWSLTHLIPATATVPTKHVVFSSGPKGLLGITSTSNNECRLCDVVKIQTLKSPCSRLNGGVNALCMATCRKTSLHASDPDRVFLWGLVKERIHKHAHAHVHTHIRAFLLTHTPKSTTHIHTRIHTHTHARARTHARLHACTYTQIDKHTRYGQAHTHSYTHRHAETDI